MDGHEAAMDTHGAVLGRQMAAMDTHGAAPGRRMVETPGHKVILDFDNTAGVVGCDVDDALALLYLLGHPVRCEVLACTCAYGNSDIDTVYGNTLDFMDGFGIDLPVYRGCAAPFAADDPASTRSPAGDFLASKAAELPGEIDLLVTGSTSNLMGAYLADDSFFDNLRSLTFMGGITSQLVFDGVVMDELNLSCDPIATICALQAPCPVTIATSQHCLPAFFTPERFERELFAPGLPYGQVLLERCRYWFEDMRVRYSLTGFVCWDVVAAASLLEPELFEDETMQVALDTGLLSYGMLRDVSNLRDDEAGPACTAAGQGTSARPRIPSVSVQVPKIADPDRFVDAMYGAWNRALRLLG